MYESTVEVQRFAINIHSTALNKALVYLQQISYRAVCPSELCNCYVCIGC